MKIYLSPSSQFGNKYVYGNTNEAEQCMKIAKHAGNFLQQYENVEVALNQNRDGYTDFYQERVDESNMWGADLHVAIHTNATSDPNRRGCEIYTYNMGQGTSILTKCIVDRFAKVPFPETKVVVKPNLYELNSTNAMALYFELDFHTSVEGCKFLINKAETIGLVIAQGIADDYNLKKGGNQQANIGKFYKVQVGAFSQRANAEQLRTQLRSKGYDAFIV